MQFFRSGHHSRYPLPGPGVLIALSSSGWIGMVSLISFGADTGFTFIGITCLTLIFKYCLITGLGRYTLATGQNIFSAFDAIPGPKNWVIWMLDIILYAEVFMMGFSSITIARLFDELTGFRYPPSIIVFFLFLCIFLLVSANSYWFFRKLLIGAIFFIVTGFGLLLMGMQVPVDEIIAGMLPDMETYMVIYDSAVIISSVGSGFSLLFYSIWLQQHLKGSDLPRDTKKILTRIRFDAGVGMFLLFALCLLFFSVGYIFLYEHGLGAPEQDLTLDIILTIMNTGYVGNIVLALICITALFCSLLGGLYGRARVFQVTLPKTIPVFVMTRRRYIGIVLCLVLSAISSHYFWTMEYVRDFIAIRLVFFTALIGILMIVDSRLSPGFRGSLLWYGIMAAGGLYSFILGLTLISCYLS